MVDVQIDSKKLRDARIRAGFSVHGAARELKKFPQAISRAESGKVGISGNLLASFCVLYKVQVTELLADSSSIAA